MKVLTAAEMRDVDRRTMELGIPGAILMENAGNRATEFLAEHFGPLERQRIVILCGKGNNGGDGYVIGRQLFTRFRTAALHVVAVFPEDRSDPRTMLEACGIAVETEITPEMRRATIVVDAVLGTGLKGPACGPALDAIREINTGFPDARVLAVDVPSGMNTDSGKSEGEVARADATVTFTAPKLCHVLAPNCDRIGKWAVAPIGSRPSLYEATSVHLLTPEYFAPVLRARPPESNKGTYGHALIVGGALGKTGAAEMAGIAALRAGAGLASVACAADRLRYPELMTVPQDGLQQHVQSRDVTAVGPGLGLDSRAVAIALEHAPVLVMDADALNVVAGTDWHAGAQFTVVTPHPGEMARLCGRSVPEVQADRLAVARDYAAAHNCCVVLKGHRTVVAFPDGETWVNPTGTPGMATGGTGDILTGLIAGFLAQFETDREAAVLGAVYLHGLAAEIAVRHRSELPMIATDILDHLGEAMLEARNVPHCF